MNMRLAPCCQECGTALNRYKCDHAFCSRECRKTFNNRRMMRGAEIYDFYMAHRFERDLAKRLGVFQAINRMASNFRAEDIRERQGRFSWRKPRAVLGERPYLKSVSSPFRIGRGSINA